LRGLLDWHGILEPFDRFKVSEMGPCYEKVAPDKAKHEDEDEDDLVLQPQLYKNK